VSSAARTVTPLLELRALDHHYGQSHTLWEVSLEVPPGRCVALMGRNGVGKTTLAKCLLGLEKVSGGEIRFDGEPIQRLAAERRARLGIGYVPQGREIFPRLTVEENLRLPLTTLGRRQVPDAVYQLFPVLKDMRDRRGGDLSGGQQQQLAIGRALVLEPRLLILDEPTEGIQPSVIQEIGNVIARLNQEQGLTVLVIEQKLKFVRRVAGDFVIMDKGRVVAAGALPDLTNEVIARHLSV
jgi:urea transport system ATP-binding protein